MDQESPLSDLVSRLALALDYPDGSDASRNLGLAKVTTFQDWMYCFFFFFKENKADSLSDLNKKILSEGPIIFFPVKETTKWARKQSVLARKATQLGLICPLCVLLPFNLAYLKRNNNGILRKELHSLEFGPKTRKKSWTKLLFRVHTKEAIHLCMDTHKILNLRGTTHFASPSPPTSQ